MANLTIKLAKKISFETNSAVCIKRKSIRYFKPFNVCYDNGYKQLLNEK